MKNPFDFHFLGFFCFGWILGQVAYELYEARRYFAMKISIGLWKLAERIGYFPVKPWEKFLHNKSMSWSCKLAKKYDLPLWDENDNFRF